MKFFDFRFNFEKKSERANQLYKNRLKIDKQKTYIKICFKYLKNIFEVSLGVFNNIKIVEINQINLKKKYGNVLTSNSFLFNFEKHCCQIWAFSHLS